VLGAQCLGRRAQLREAGAEDAAAGRQRVQRGAGREAAPAVPTRRYRVSVGALLCGKRRRGESGKRGSEGAGKRGGCRGETPRTPPAAGEAEPLPYSLWRGGTFSSIFVVARWLSRGDPPNPPPGRRAGRTRAPSRQPFL
jgi:hypothetical protein